MRKRSFDAAEGSVFDRTLSFLRYKKALTHLPASLTSVVDLGCGRTAPLVQLLVRQGRAQRGIGVDCDVEDSSPHPDVHFVATNLNAHIPLPDEDTDAVVSLAVLEHLTAPDTYLAEAYRILRPGGTLFLTTPSPRAEPVLNFLAFKLNIIDAREIADHKQYFSTVMVRDALMLAGFVRHDIRITTFQCGMNVMAVAVK